MKIGIIADDLTGANGTGVQLAEQGIPSITYLSDAEIIKGKRSMAVCIDTDSRYVSKTTVKIRIINTLEKLKNWNVDLVCKRIDSTFRGNIAIELDTMFKHLNQDAIGIIVPSVPLSNRIVVGGNLLVNGVPLHETEVSNDPIRPIKQSFLPAILKEQTDFPIDTLSLTTVSSDIKGIEHMLRKKINMGAKLIICDATTEEHIQSIASAMIRIKEKNLIPVDPGPLTKYFIQGKENKEEHKKSLLISIGSATTTTTRQIETFIKTFNIEPIYVQSEKLIKSGGVWKEEVERAISIGMKRIAEQSFILISTNKPNMSIIDLKRIAEKKNIPSNLLAKRITDGLAEISKQLLIRAEGQIKACFFSGGDVTASFSKATRAYGIQLIEEVMPIVTYGKLLGGEFDGLPLITKGGLIGGDEALVQCIHFLEKKLFI